jgi:internalin A
MGQPLNTAWKSARDAILARPEPQIPFDEFAQTCAEEELDDNATATLANMLHDLGNVVYYAEDEGLRDIMVLNPEWLTKAISYVLEDQSTEDTGGILDHVRLAQIWGGERGDGGYPAQCHAYFLRLMEKFDISYRIPDEDRRLVAQMVPYERPALPWDGGADPHHYRSLTLICRLSEPVDGLISWFTVRHHHYSVGRHWRRGVFLKHPEHGSEALLVEGERRGRDLTLSVRGPSPDNFFNVLREGLEFLIKRRWKGLDYELLVVLCYSSGVFGRGRSARSIGR